MRVSCRNNITHQPPEQPPESTAGPEIREIVPWYRLLYLSVNCRDAVAIGSQPRPVSRHQAVKKAPSIQGLPGLNQPSRSPGLTGDALPYGDPDRQCAALPALKSPSQRHRTLTGNQMSDSNKKPTVLIVLDGWGYREDTRDNAIANGATPVGTAVARGSTHADLGLRTGRGPAGGPDGKFRGGPYEPGFRPGDLPEHHPYRPGHQRRQL